MFASVARSGRVSASSPGPKNSVNFCTTPYSRRTRVNDNTISVVVIPSFGFPTNLIPITSGIIKFTGSPSIAESASIPPTPHPNTDKALIIGV